MKGKKFLSLLLALTFVFTPGIGAYGYNEAEIEEDVSFIEQHKDIFGLYYSARYEKIKEKLYSPDTTEEEMQLLTEEISTLRTAVENCLEGKHYYLIALPDMEGPFECTSLGVCEYCDHSEIILTGDGYREIHTDKNKDGICDDCKRQMPHIGCNHFCHSENILVQKLLLPIFRRIWNLFGIEEYCRCGTYHFYNY